jgi:hypothetical protein
MTAAVLTAWLLAAPWAAQVQDRVAGLLALPEVFGAGACDRFTPEIITLYAAPDSRQVVGSIRVDTYWTFHERGGCEGLVVNVHRAGAGRVGEFPTREYEYEAPAAIVLEQRGRWFRVRLPDGAAWLRASQRDEFLPLERLLPDRLTYLTSAWDGRLAALPGAVMTPVERSRPGADVHVRLVELRRVGDDLWVHVEVLSHSGCESAEEPGVTARGWLPAHAPSGEPTIWFFSRGC